MSTPRPFGPVRGSRTGRPVMALMDLLGRRMAMRVLWELRDGPLTFRALQGAAGTNPAVLNTRLRELRDVRLVRHGADGYELTAAGMGLMDLWSPINRWAEGWARSLERTPEEG